MAHDRSIPSSATQDNPLLDAALDYARRGWPVFPCHTPMKSGCSCQEGADCTSIGKHPQYNEDDLPHGCNSATTDEAQLITWWQRWPRANIGLRTGDIVVIDFDPRHHSDVGEALLAAEGCTFPETVHSITGSGGRHLFYQHDGVEVRNSVGAEGKGLAVGIDVRGAGGLVILPPSLHASRQRYVWEASSHPDALTLAPLPAWIVARCTGTAKPVRKGQQDAAGRIAEGQRNDSLASFAGTMRRGGMKADEMLAALLVINTNRCVPPLAEAEVRKIAESIERYAPSQPHLGAERDGQQASGTTPATRDTSTPLPLSDTTNGEALVQDHGRNLRYCHPAKQWYVWDGRRWLADDTAAIMRFAKQTLKAMAAKVQHMDDDERAKAWLQHLKTSLSTHRLKGMVEAATWEPTIPLLPTQMDQDPWLFNCLNGTIDLRSGERQSHQRADLITLLAPVAYDPLARSPVFDAFLQRMLPDDAVRRYVQKAAGYSLTGVGTEEVLFFPFGRTKTGKSTLLRALRATMGEYATTADFETFLARDYVSGAPRADIADLAGKRLVISLEVDQGKRLAESLIKWLFGGDYIKARFLYKREFEFLPSFKLWLAANHRPAVRPDDDAIWERIRQIPFDQQIPPDERNPAIKAELCNPDQSGAAILAWAVEGCLLWQEEGLRPPGDVKQSTEDYRSEMDPLPDFLDACTVKEPGKILNAALWESYQAWARKNPDRPRIGRKTFTQRLEAHGVDSIESGGYRYWIDMRLKYGTAEES